MKCINCKNIDLKANRIASNHGFAYCRHFCESAASGMAIGFERECEKFELADAEKLIARKAWADKQELNHKRKI